VSRLFVLALPREQRCLGLLEGAARLFRGGGDLRAGFAFGLHCGSYALFDGLSLGQLAPEFVESLRTSELVLSFLLGDLLLAPGLLRTDFELFERRPCAGNGECEAGDGRVTLRALCELLRMRLGQCGGGGGSRQFRSRVGDFGSGEALARGGELRLGGGALLELLDLSLQLAMGSGVVLECDTLFTQRVAALLRGSESRRCGSQLLLGLGDGACGGRRCFGGDEGVSLCIASGTGDVAQRAEGFAARA